MKPIVITAALTGPIATKADHPGLPTTPEEIAAAATAAYKAGAAVAHVHLRDERGLPTANLDIAKRVLDLIQEQSPILVQLSTGVGLDVPYGEREKLVELRPRMATLNPCTMSFGVGEFRNPPKDVRRLAARMRELGVKAELEVYDSGHLDMCLTLLKEGLLVEPLQFSIVMGVKGGMSASAENLLYNVGRLPSTAIWQGIAVGRSNLELTTVSIAIGGNARTGLEDTLLMRKGELADNGRLVARLAEVCKTLGRPIATVDETKKLLGLEN
ncbi:MAG TPA: 3-keto-5-aminohexanoate cleavage protein [Patescibacteria group bacterium]|nr:3-keto-5-aminohexanoate cleavage protein [Patescibacteria group bacterium]